MENYPIPSASNDYHDEYVGLILRSLEKCAGILVVEPSDRIQEQAKQVFEADFALLAHNTGADPIFRYANLKALRLFEMSWDEITRLPSRYSAEEVERTERSAYLERVSRDGFVDNYSGIRISKSGRRFRIKNALIWNVVDAAEQYIGQAAIFREFDYL